MMMRHPRGGPNRISIAEPATVACSMYRVLTLMDTIDQSFIPKTMMCIGTGQVLPEHGWLAA